MLRESSLNPSYISQYGDDLPEFGIGSGPTLVALNLKRLVKLNQRMLLMKGELCDRVARLSSYPIFPSICNSSS
jgi:hypothetical protein